MNIFLVIGFLLTGILIGGMLAYLFGYNEYEEVPLDPEGLAESQSEFRTDYCNKLISIICNMYSIQADEAELKQHGVDLNCYVFELGFRNVSFAIKMDFDAGKYFITAYKFGAENKVTRMRGCFKFDPNDAVNYKDVIEFIAAFDAKSEDITKLSYEDLINEVADIANDPEMIKLAETEKEGMIYKAAIHLAGGLTKRSARRNKDIVYAYTILMAHLVGSGKLDEFIKYAQTAYNIEDEEEKQ